jgi:hypothetical protein
VASVVHALASVTLGGASPDGAPDGAPAPRQQQQLPPSSYCYVFPVLQVRAGV